MKKNILLAVALLAASATAASAKDWSQMNPDQRFYRVGERIGAKCRALLEANSGLVAKIFARPYISSVDESDAVAEAQSRCNVLKAQQPQAQAR